VGAHQFTIGFDDLASLRETAVFSEGFEKVFSQVVSLARLGQERADAFLLFLEGDGGVFQKGAESLILGYEAIEGLEILFDSIESVLTSGSNVKSSGVTTIKTEEGERSLS
jgi:hypothetical protein